MWGYGFHKPGSQVFSKDPRDFLTFFLPPNSSVTLTSRLIIRALVYSAVNEVGLVVKYFKFSSVRDA